MCCIPALGYAQADSAGFNSEIRKESVFTFAEAMTGDNDDAPQNVTIAGSRTNAYAEQAGYVFAPTLFRYRALPQKYSTVYANGTPMNDMENGQFGYTQTGGLNTMTRNVSQWLPFETAGCGMASTGGTSGYDLRAAGMAPGHYLSVGGANRNYAMRGAYSYASGTDRKGWAFAGGLTYRWANQGYAEGTTYKSLSYFLAVQKLWPSGHSLALTTWGAPTKRDAQGASTDEAYLLADNKQYNPYWGYQDGKKRNARTIHDFEPTALLTWDWTIDNRTKLTTSMLGRYSMRKSTRLNYNGDNPAPDYWQNMPSSKYNTWNPADPRNTDEARAEWQDAYEYWTADKSHRQINWDKLYGDNKQAAASGSDAIYYMQARHNNALSLSLASMLSHRIDDRKKISAGLDIAAQKGMHYLTLDDLLGARQIHNISTYAIGNYSATSDRVQYDLNRRDAAIGKGDRFGHDYNLTTGKAQLWSTYAEDLGPLHYSLSARLAYNAMQRDGKTKNGMAPGNSYGKSKAKSLADGGLKLASTLSLGHAGALSLGIGYEMRAPQASAAFVSPETSNETAAGLKDERIFSAELGYAFDSEWLHASIGGYYSRIDDATEWHRQYFADSYAYADNSITGLSKAYYGLEAGLKLRLARFLDLNMAGTISQAKNTNDAHVRYTLADTGESHDATLHTKDTHEAGTPLTAASVGLSYHQRGWFIDINANCYDRIYLTCSDATRYDAATEQAKGHGGFMLDGAIGRSVRLKRGTLAINLAVSNILNNRNICIGGYEQSYNKADSQTMYNFAKNPKKFYALGANGMLNITYKF